MSAQYKALIVVLGITMIVFFLARPLFANFIAAKDYALRRNLWLALACAAFLIPNYWAFALVAALLLIYGLNRDTNPAALYLCLILTIPPFAMEIPTLGLVNQVFPLDHLRLLSLAILLPLYVRVSGSTKASEEASEPADSRSRKTIWPDALILSYVALQLILLIPNQSPTASIRRAFLLSIDVLLPYFVLSRACRSRREIVDAMASLALAAVVLSCLAVFETLKSWLLFASLEESWGASGLTSFIRRGDSLRAQVTAGHPIVLGYAFAIALSFWLYLQSKAAHIKSRWLVIASLVAGLAATHSRGPWVGALAIVLLYSALGPHARTRTLKATGLLVVAAGAVWASPWGAEIIDRLPFIGTSDQEGSVLYRQQIAAMSWLLIQQNPLFGSASVFKYMEDLRQGEGIIDMVNTYAYIALVFGLVGLSFFVGFFVVIIVRCFRSVRRLAASDPDLSLIGAGLLASILGSLIIIATVGLYLSISYLVWAVGGLAVGYTELVRRKEQFKNERKGASVNNYNSRERLWKIEPR